MEGEVPSTRGQVLIVEDEGIVAHNLRQILEDLGYSVAGIADCAGEALELASKESIDLVLMDITIRGEVDGIELAELLHRRYQMPVVYTTAHTDPVTLARIERSQPFGFIVKPFRPSKIAVAIDFALHRAGLHARLLEKESRIAAILQAMADVSSATPTAGPVGSLPDPLIVREQLETAQSSLDRVRTDLSRISYALHHDLAEPMRTVSLMCQVIQRSLQRQPDAETVSTLATVIAGCSKIEAELQVMRDFCANVVRPSSPL